MCGAQKDRKRIKERDVISLKGKELRENEGIPDDIYFCTAQFVRS